MLFCKIVFIKLKNAGFAKSTEKNNTIQKLFSD